MSKGRGRQTGKAKKKTSVAVSGPVMRWAVAGVFLTIAVIGSIAMGLPALAATKVGEAIGNAGFTVRRVDVQGIHHMDSAPVYQIAFDQRSMAMPLVDVSAIRDQLMHFGWIQDARVSRRLPDTLVIDIVERQPAALWQYRQQVSLIDANGVVLQKLPPDKIPDLPLLIGPGANGQAVALNRMMKQVPTLKPQLASASWIGGRRWDLAFTSGETIALPEGEKAAIDALVRFAKVDKSTGVLGRGFLRIDLRLPGKMVVRLPRAPGEGIEPANTANSVESE